MVVFHGILWNFSPISRLGMIPSGVIKHGVLEIPLGIEVLIGTSLIKDQFSIAIFDHRKVSNLWRTDQKSLTH